MNSSQNVSAGESVALRSRLGSLSSSLEFNEVDEIDAYVGSHMRLFRPLFIVGIIGKLAEKLVARFQNDDEIDRDSCSDCSSPNSPIDQYFVPAQPTTNDTNNTSSSEEQTTKVSPGEIHNDAQVEEYGNFGELKGALDFIWGVSRLDS